MYSKITAVGIERRTNRSAPLFYVNRSGMKGYVTMDSEIVDHYLAQVSSPNRPPQFKRASEAMTKDLIASGREITTSGEVVEFFREKVRGNA